MRVFLVSLCLAAAARAAEMPQAELRPQATASDPRSQRPWVVSGEAGWNSLSGIGVLVARHLETHLTLEAGVGLSPEGPKFGLRGRWGFSEGEWTPFVGAGFSYATGQQGTQVETTSSGSFSYTVGTSPFLQLAAGAEYQSQGGFSFVGAVGYAKLLRHNLTIVSGNPSDDDLSALRLLTGSGIVASAAFGYAF